MQGDSFGSTRSLTVPPTVPPAKNSSPQAQCGGADLFGVGRGRIIEEHGLHAHTALALLVERESQEHDDLGDQTPGAVARRGSDGQWWLR